MKQARFAIILFLNARHDIHNTRNLNAASDLLCLMPYRVLEDYAVLYFGPAMFKIARLLVVAMMYVIIAWHIFIFTDHFKGHTIIML